MKHVLASATQIRPVQSAAMFKGNVQESWEETGRETVNQYWPGGREDWPALSTLLATEITTASNTARRWAVFCWSD